MFFIYIIYSKLRGRYYVGQTNNLTNRLIRHNNGGVKSIKSGVPWQLIHKEVFVTRSGAMQKENQIKSRGAERYLKDIR